MRRWRSWLQSKWGKRLLWLVPLLSLVFETDLTALLWIGTTLIALIFVPAARQATLAMVYRNVPLSLAIGTAIEVRVGAQRLGDAGCGAHAACCPVGVWPPPACS